MKIADLPPEIAAQLRMLAQTAASELERSVAPGGDGSVAYRDGRIIVDIPAKGGALPPGYEVRVSQAGGAFTFTLIYEGAVVISETGPMPS